MAKIREFMLEPLLGRIRSGSWRKVYVFGGRGTGKTSLLEAIAADSEMEPLRVSPDSPAPGSLPSSGIVLIDDIDLCPENVVRGVVEKACAPDSALRVAMTARTPLESVAPWISERIRPEYELIEPWAPGWAGRLETALVEASDRPGDLARLLAELTGGHPALLGPALDEVERQPDLASCAREASVAALATLKTRVTAYLEQRVMPAFLRRLKRVRETAPSAADTLVEAARSPQRSAPMRERQVLTREGLAYFDVDTGELTVPLGLVQTWILAEASEALWRPAEVQESLPALGGARAACDVDLLTLQTSLHEAGILRIRREGSDVSLRFRGASWTILRTLYGSPDKVFSKDELSKATGIESESGLNSAVQRLLTRLKSRGFENVVVNIWGKGYQAGLKAGSKG